MDTICNIRNHTANVLPLCSLIILAIMLSEGILCSGLRIQCNERDKFLLQNFKHTVVDPSSILYTWSDERDCCEWEGVRCDNNTGRVIKLSLPCHGQDPFGVDCGEKKPQCLTGENNFNGSLTNWMLPNVKILRLRSNQLSGNIPPRICQLASLIVLDFAENKILGSLPNCLQNLTAMTSPDSSKNGVYRFCIRTPGLVYEIEGTVMVHIKGQGSSYGDNLKYLHAIDLSSNNISGTIPPEIFSLTGLQSLNLSHNELEGKIPNEISNMKILESLDLSSNRLSGEIPPSMANLSFLETLNISFNNFIGKIPLGTQLQGFDALSYIGNPLLCGAPLPKNCTNKKDAEPIEGNGSQEDEFLNSFYIGMGVGFAMSFWGVCAAIFFNWNFRHAYFRFLYHIRDKLYVMAVLKMNQFH